MIEEVNPVKMVINVCGFYGISGDNPLLAAYVRMFLMNRDGIKRPCEERVIRSYNKKAGQITREFRRYKEADNGEIEHSHN